ncbi:MAG: GGDEF domain-containing protein [Deltaproteobacteria bacterium]|nr:GGDEF domain-containing protein [Deltaproteobacteria bacterium]
MGCASAFHGKEAMSQALSFKAEVHVALPAMQGDGETPGDTPAPRKVVELAPRAAAGDGTDSRRASAPHLLRLEGEGHGDLVRIDEAQFVLGRDQQPTLPINHRGVSRRHAQIFWQRGEWFIEDLGSKNGTLLNHHLIGLPVKLSNDDLINLGNGAVFRYIDDPMADDVYRGRMTTIGPRDPVTNTMAPSDFDVRALCELAFHARYDLPLAYVVADIDKPPTAEDSLVLAKELARRIRNAVRKQDLLCHLGQNRFAVLYRQTSRQDALKFAERIRAEVADQPFRLGNARWKMTLSAGVAAIPGHQSTLGGLKAFAEFALELAKAGGGNRVHTAQ